MRTPRPERFAMVARRAPPSPNRLTPVRGGDLSGAKVRCARFGPGRRVSRNRRPGRRPPELGPLAVTVVHERTRLMTEGLGTPGTTPDPIVTTGGSGATAPTAGVGTTSTRVAPRARRTPPRTRPVASPTRASKAASTSQRWVRTRPSRSRRGRPPGQGPARPGAVRAGGPRVQPADPRRRPAALAQLPAGLDGQQVRRGGPRQGPRPAGLAADRLRRPLAVRSASRATCSAS